MRLWCESCDGRGYDEYPDYDWDENILDEGIKVVCDDCKGSGYIGVLENKDAIQRMAGYISTLDVDEDICSKQDHYCKFADEGEFDKEDCVDCIIDFFSSPCRWEHDEFCVNDKSEWFADFAYSNRCGRCKYYEKPR